MDNSPEQSSRAHPRLTIFVHVFHVHIWDEISNYISSSMGTPFDLIITGPHDESVINRPKTKNLHSMRVVITENRGRDVLPFLKALEVADPFDFGLKLHTKRSQHHDDGQGWQTAIMTSLVGGDAPTRILEAFEREAALGLVAPKGMLLGLRLRSRACWNSMSLVLECLQQPVLSREERNRRNFIAGTMFWFRSAAMPTLPVGQLDDHFEPEAGQTDGTTAHALERLFSLLAYRRGYASVPEDRLLDVAGQSLIEMENNARKATEKSARFFLNLPTPIMWLLETYPRQMRVVKILPTSWRMSLRRLLDKNR